MHKISVIIPTYNTEKYISETVNAVLAQTHKNYEIIVIDDGSTDGTKQILSHYNSKIRYLYQENKGPSSARNSGMREARGEYIAFLDADDLWLPEKLEKQVKFLDENPDYGLVTCDSMRFDDTGIITPSMARERRLHSGNVLENLLRENFLNTNNVLIRREVFDKVGFFDENRRFSEDYELWIRIAKHYKIGYIDEVLTKYRIHGSNRSKQNKDEVYNAHIEVMFNHLKDSGLSFFEKRRIVSYNYWKLGYNYFDEGQYKKAREYLSLSIKKNPFFAKPYFYLFVSYLSERVINNIRNFKRMLANLIKTRGYNGTGCSY